MNKQVTAKLRRVQQDRRAARKRAEEQLAYERGGEEAQDVVLYSDRSMGRGRERSIQRKKNKSTRRHYRGVTSRAQRRETLEMQLLVATGAVPSTAEMQENVRRALWAEHPEQCEEAGVPLPVGDWTPIVVIRDETRGFRR